jgi:hypothetical protein
MTEMPAASAGSSLSRRRSRRPRRFALTSLRLRLGAERFEVSIWDSLPAHLLLGLALYGGWFLFSLRSPLLYWAYGGLALLAGLPRCVVTVTRTGSWAEHRLLGLCWRRRDLGVRPKFDCGPVWGWSELSVTPSDERLRERLHDRDRFVLAEWEDDNESKTADAERVAALANAEVVRLHEGVETARRRQSDG